VHHKHAASPTPSRHRHHLEDNEGSPTPSPTAAPDETPANTHGNYAPDASIDPSELREFSKQPERVRMLLQNVLALTKLGLTYTFSSADPANGGMDCSGFIYYVLRQNGFTDVPRQSDEQYAWVRKAGNFRAVLSRKGAAFEMNELKPGDLMFWTGTYETDRDPPVTHTMIYLGTEKGTGKGVMAGSSDGRSYHGQRRWGVSVFDFDPAHQAPEGAKSGVRFVGYGAIPGI
jgi:cell wall-associated NlpC family hydrolase